MCVWSMNTVSSRWLVWVMLWTWFWVIIVFFLQLLSMRHKYEYFCLQIFYFLFVMIYLLRESINFILAISDQFLKIFIWSSCASFWLRIIVLIEPWAQSKTVKLDLWFHKNWLCWTDDVLNLFICKSLSIFKHIEGWVCFC